MRARIIERIESDGPMPFDEYMEMCLYDAEDGFFSAGPVRSGKKGDFVTSPELSWILSYGIGEWMKDQEIATLDYIDQSVALVEVGGGSGQLLRGLADPWIWSDMPIYAVELSAEGRRAVAELIPSANVVSSIDEIPAGIDVVIVANEVLDNMPAALARRTATGWDEIVVGIDGESLSLIDQRARPVVSAWCGDAFRHVDEGSVVSVQLAATQWIDKVVDHFGAIRMCIFDYGAKSEELAARSPSEVVRTYRKHQANIDWLQHPGASDITVDVNITAILNAIARAGQRVRLMTQRAFLREYDAEGPIDDAWDREHAAASKGNVMAQLTARSERLDMEALIDPNGLGAFSVILVEQGS